jgi:hypothetical protein|tara:strand:- start:2494 stop:2988 length:495 start_codon:yes stop_codon:yes gene_type:complete
MKKHTHLHHIIPKHIGGSNDPSNLIELTVEEHAEAHRVLYEEHGRWQDHIAWKALSGQIGKEEIIRAVQGLANKGRVLTEEHKVKLREARKKQHNSGWNWSEESRKAKSEAVKGIPRPKESNAKTSKAMSGIAKPKVKCPHCGKEGGAPQMRQWHFDNCKNKVF